MPSFDKEVTLYDVDVEIELTPEEVAEEFARCGELDDLIHAIHKESNESLADWIRANRSEFPDLLKPTLTPEQVAALDRAASILDALQTLMGMGDASQIAMHLRTIARPTT